MSMQQITIYRNGQIFQQATKPCFKAAMKFAAHELGKAIEHLTLDKKYDVTMATYFLTSENWAATVETDGAELFGITVDKY